MPVVAAMYSVEITVEKDKVTGETRVLSSSTRSPQQPLPQGVKVYEDETKGRRQPVPCSPVQGNTEPRPGLVSAVLALSPPGAATPTQRQGRP